VTVDVQAEGANSRLSISDDGIGGADPHKGVGRSSGWSIESRRLRRSCGISSLVGSGTSLLASLLATIPSTDPDRHTLRPWAIPGSQGRHRWVVAVTTWRRARGNSGSVRKQIRRSIDNC